MAEVIATVYSTSDLKDSSQIVKNFLVSGDCTRTPVRLWQKAKKYRIKGQHMFRRSGTAMRMIPAIHKRQFMITACYDQIDYWEIFATVGFVARTLWWPAMKRDATKCIKSCWDFQLSSKENNISYNHHQHLNCFLTHFLWISLDCYWRRKESADRYCWAWGIFHVGLIGERKQKKQRAWKYSSSKERLWNNLEVHKWCRPNRVRRFYQLLGRTDWNLIEQILELQMHTIRS